MLGIPGVIWKDKNGTERSVDLYTRLLTDRIVMVTGQITAELAESVVAQLLYLESLDKDKPIKMFITSEGGSVLAGNAIISTMNIISCPVHTTIVGLAASMGIVIAASGEKGHRSVYPMSRIMIHQASGGQQGNIQDVRSSYKEMEKVNDMILEHLASCCDKDVETVRKDSERDTWYGPEEIIAYGLVDKIAQPHKKESK